jgi:flagellar protein FliS
MQSMAQDNYLATNVQTATPQKLKLLLLDAALRMANRTRQYWQEGRFERAIESLDRAQSIVAEMRAGIKYEAAGELAERVSMIYEFIFRSLVDAGCQRDEKKLDDAIRILEIERETWRQVCDKLAGATHRGLFDGAQGSIVPSPLGDLGPLELSSGGFSMEA